VYTRFNPSVAQGIGGVGVAIIFKKMRTILAFMKARSGNCRACGDFLPVEEVVGDPPQ